MKWKSELYSTCYQMKKKKEIRVYRGFESSSSGPGRDSVSLDNARALQTPAVTMN